MKERAIGVFDSGLGGLTVVRELLAALPGEDIVYFGDTGRVPYGSRSREALEEYARQDQRFLLSQDVKLVIAACGTVSSVVPYVGEELPVPFLGVVSPAADAAVQATRNGKIGVIGTIATIASKAYGRELLKRSPGLTISERACPLFVPLVEAGWFGESDEVALLTARRYLEGLKEEGVDTLILGCTHYPILTGVIRRVMGEEPVLINTGKTAAAAASALLREKGLLNPRAAGGRCRYFVSDRTEDFARLAGVFLSRPVDEVQRVDITAY